MSTEHAFRTPPERLRERWRTRPAVPSPWAVAFVAWLLDVERWK